MRPADAFLFLDGSWLEGGCTGEPAESSVGFDGFGVAELCATWLAAWRVDDLVILGLMSNRVLGSGWTVEKSGTAKANRSFVCIYWERGRVKRWKEDDDVHISSLHALVYCRRRSFVVVGMARG